MTVAALAVAIATHFVAAAIHPSLTEKYVDKRHIIPCKLLKERGKK